MPEARGHGVIVTCFVDANHGGNLKDRKSQTGVLIFINKAPIHWYSKSQTTVEASTFGAEFCAMNSRLVQGVPLSAKPSASTLKPPPEGYRIRQALLPTVRTQ